MRVHLPVIHLWSTKQINSFHRKEKDKKDSRTQFLRKLVENELNFNASLQRSVHYPSGVNSAVSCHNLCMEARNYKDFMYLPTFRI